MCISHVYKFIGDFKLTESMSILRHFGRKGNLYGHTQNQAAHIDMIVDVAQDVKVGMVKVCMDKEFVSWDMYFSVLDE